MLVDAGLASSLYSRFEFERGICEPDLIVLLRYARLAGCTMEDLVDDAIKWP